MKSKLVRPIHNPNRLTPAEYGASEGYRLLFNGEQPKYVEARTPNGTHWFVTTLTKGVSKSDGSSYRTRTDLNNMLKISEICEKASREILALLDSR